MTTTHDLTIRIRLEPVAQPRAQVTTIRPKDKPAFSHTYTPGDTVGPYKARIVEEVGRVVREPLEGPVRVDLLLAFPRTKALSFRFAKPRATGHGPDRRWKFPVGLLWKLTKPDRDNLEKAVLDALKPYWGDDAQVVCGQPLKVWARAGGFSELVIRLRSGDEVPDPELLAAELGLVERTPELLGRLLAAKREEVRRLELAASGFGGRQ